MARLYEMLVFQECSELACFVNKHACRRRVLCLFTVQESKPLAFCHIWLWNQHGFVFMFTTKTIRWDAKLCSVLISHKSSNSTHTKTHPKRNIKHSKQSREKRAHHTQNFESMLTLHMHMWQFICSVTKNQHIFSISSVYKTDNGNEECYISFRYCEIQN